MRNLAIKTTDGSIHSYPSPKFAWGSNDNGVWVQDTKTLVHMFYPYTNIIYTREVPK